VSTRAVIIAIAVSLAAGLLCGVLVPKVGAVVFLLPIAVGCALGPTLANWDIRSGKQGWFS
jgi:hypothetical protein